MLTHNTVDISKTANTHCMLAEDFKKVTEGLSDMEEILISTIIPDIQAELACRHTPIH